MRVLCFTTHTDCENKVRSIEAAGHEVHAIQYDDRPHDRHPELVDEARALSPDALVFIGAVERYHGRPVIWPDVHCALREIAPYVHMCNDAADPPWWSDLEEYHRRSCFDVQVSIDGSHATPLAEFSEGVVKLTPIDHRPFVPTPWDARQIRIGMIGGHGINRRGAAVTAAMSAGLDFRNGPDGRSYDDYARTLCEMRAVFNFPESGSGQVFHVKGRVVEAGFAGAVLIERAGAPTAEWFEPGVDYLEYEDPTDAPRLADSATAEMAERFHARIVEDHHPRVFWDEILTRARACR